MIKILESVIINYDENFKIQYQNLVEFLNLLGIFVVDKPNTQDLESCDTLNEYELSTISTEMFTDFKNNVEEDYFADWYEQILEIYKKYDLFTASITLKYFRMKHNETEKAGKNFENATEAIIQLINTNDNYENNPHLRYARLYCKQKANLASFLCENPIVYYVNDLAYEGLSLINAFPNFANAWFLLGLVYEISKDYVKDANDAFRHAIDIVGEKPYTSDFYYWIGRRCEEHENLNNLQFDSYKKSYELLPNYRNSYKLARYYLDNNNLSDAIIYFQECLNYLKQEKYLNPLEQYYFFTVKVNICYIYLQKKNYYQCILNGIDALNFQKNINNKEESYIDFYYLIYGKDKAQIFMDMTLSKLNCLQIYRYLAIAYQECGMSEIADNYWNLYRG